MIGLVDGKNFFVSCEQVIKPSLRGKPVAVLSNNDGCCVSRSNEFKALSIPMRPPDFQLKDREASGKLNCTSARPTTQPYYYHVVRLGNLSPNKIP